MTRIDSLLRIFRPRSNLALACIAFIYVTGAGLSPLVNGIAAVERRWLAQYLAVVVLGGLGFGLGMVLRKIRTWTASPLIPGLYRATTITATGLGFLFWVPYAGVMILTDGLDRFSPALSLASSAGGLVFGAGIHRRASILVLAAIVAAIALPATRTMGITMLRDPLAEPAFILFVLIAAVELLRNVQRPIRERDLIRDERIVFASVERTRVVPIPRLFSWMPVPVTSQRAALFAALEHTPAQAWFNDLMAIAIASALPALVGLVDHRGGVRGIMGVSFLATTVAVLLPLMRRSILAHSIDLLWLAGAGDTRRALVFTAFLRLLLSPVRICAIGSVAALLIHGPTLLAAFPVAQLVIAPGCASIALATSMWLGEGLKRNEPAIAILFGLIVLVVMLTAGWYVGWIAKNLAFGEAMGLSVVTSALAILASAHVAATLAAARREWAF